MMSSTQPTQTLAAPGTFELGAPAAYTAGGAEAGGGIGFADVLRILKQRKLTILITFVVLYLLVVIMTLAIRRWAPAWSSEAVLEMDPPRDSMKVDEPQLNPDIMEQMVQTEARKLRQLGVLFRVLELPEVKQTRFYAWYNNDVARAAFELQNMLSSAPIPQTRLFRVSLSVSDPKEAQLIVGRVVKRYLDRFQEQSKDALRHRVDGLRNTLAERNRRLKELREGIAKFRETREVPHIELERSVAVDQISYLLQQLTQVDIIAAQLQTQLAVLSSVPSHQLPITPEMRLLIEADPILRYYRSTVEAYDVQMQTMLQVVGEDHRQFRIMRTSRQAWAEKETARREELVTDVRDRQIESLRQDLAAARSITVRIQAELADTQAKQRDLDRNFQQFKQMVTDEELLLKDIAEIQSFVAQADHAMADQSRERRVSVVQDATLAVKPSRPDYLVFLGGGFVLSLIGAVGLAFLREFTDQAIRTPLDVVRFGQLSVLGNIPLIDDEQADVDAIEQATRKAPHSLVAEAFRQVRTNLLFSGPAELQKAILVTSPGAGDGKTAVVINLAITLAHGNQRVLIIDCNFRRPSIRDLLPNTRREGLSNVLVGQGRWSDYVTHTDLPNVDVLSSGPMPPRPADLLGSSFMTELVQEAKRAYDRVLLDGPPALLISDAMVVATQVDGVILVARAVNNTKGALRRTREQLDRLGARVFGVVLNGVQARPGGYFRRQYREFYEYVGDETIPADLPELTAGDPNDKRGPEPGR
jgi:succinoglycan biosynthesis transport protein ExoP